MEIIIQDSSYNLRPTGKGGKINFVLGFFLFLSPQLLQAAIVLGSHEGVIAKQIRIKTTKGCHGCSLSNSGRCWRRRVKHKTEKRRREEEEEEEGMILFFFVNRGCPSQFTRISTNSPRH